MNNLHKYWNKFSAVGVLSIGGAVGIVVPTLATPFLVYLYSTEQIGELGLFSSFLGVLGQIICLKYDLALTLHPDKKSSLFSLCILFSLIGSSLVALGLLFLQIFWQIPLQFIILISLGALFVGVNLSINSLSIATGRFASSAIGTAIRGISAAALQIIFGYTLKNGLILGYILSYLISSVFLIFANRNALPKRIQPVSKLKIVFIEHKNFFQFTTLGSVGAAMVTSITNIFILGAYDAQYLGLYTIINRIFVAPLLLFGGCIGQVYGKYIGASYPDHQGIHMIRVSFERCLVFICILYAMASIGGLYFFEHSFSLAWQGIFAVALPIILLCCIRLWIVPQTPTLLVYQKQAMLMFWQLSMLLFGFVSGFISIWIGVGITGFLWVQTIVLSICYLWIYQKITGCFSQACQKGL